MVADDVVDTAYGSTAADSNEEEKAKASREDQGYRADGGEGAGIGG